MVTLCEQSPGLHPSTPETGGGSAPCNPSTWEVEIGRSTVQGDPPLHSESEASLGYMCVMVLGGLGGAMETADFGDGKLALLLLTPASEDRYQLPVL